MTDPAQPQLLVAGDLDAIEDDGCKHELEHGLLLSEPLPGARHGLVVGAVAAELRHFSMGRRLGVVLAGDPAFILHRSPDTVRGPDVAFIARERYESLEDPSKPIVGTPFPPLSTISPRLGRTPGDWRGQRVSL